MDNDRLIQIALAEDLIDGRDATTDAFIDADAVGAGWIEARETAVVSGLALVQSVLHAVDQTLQVALLVADGARVAPGDRVLTVAGAAHSLLRGERTALNFLCHLSGIATSTRALVDLIRPWGTVVLGTRKTLPGLRECEIEAVRHGGGDVYRANLSDAVLLKDNHLGILGGLSGVQQRLERQRAATPAAAERILATGKIEVSSLAELDAAVAMGWTQILLDNFPPGDVREAVRRCGKRIQLEVSGGVTLQNISAYAETGVQAVSVGAITHSSRAVDFSLEVQWRQ